jgi:hypothetical protein
VVDPSLLRQASDRGVTICFADLDGADGLWVPEERTVLVNRGLSEAKVAEVIEHELTHVMIDDQHADLDAGRDVLIGRPPLRSRRWVVGLAAAGIVAVVGGVTLGMKANGGPADEQVAPPQPGLTASESGQAPPSPVLSPSVGPDGRIVYVTVTAPARSAPAVSPSGTPAGTPASTRSPMATSPAPKATVPAPPPATVSPTPPPASIPANPPVTPTPDPTTPEAPVDTTPPGAGASLPGDGDTGAGAASGDAPVGGDAPVSGDVPVSGAADASDVLIAASGVADAVVAPTG